jgi:hypothetical protein
MIGCLPACQKFTEKKKEKNKGERTESILDYFFSKRLPLGSDQPSASGGEIARPN